jgi:hypothetical protein
MRAPRSLSLALAASLPIALGAGCGGGPEQVTAEELVQQGDQICREQQSRFTEIQAAPLVSASDGAEEAQALHDAAEESIDKLGDLEPPEPQRATYDRYLDAKEQTLQYFDDGKDAADDQDGRAYSAAQAAVAKGAPERAKLARALGFRVCSQGPGAGLAAG